MPRVSVFMPLHNGAPYADAAIRSILGQTLDDIELVIVENGSTDESLTIAREHAEHDPRIVVIDAGGPLGVAGAANAAIEASRAPVVARMDQDDLSAPRRLELELEALKSEPGAVLVAALSTGIDARGRNVRPVDRWRLARPAAMPPFVHGSSMFRRDAWEQAGGYRAEAGLWEDVDLFLRMTRLGRIYAVPRALYAYRFTSSSATSQVPADGQDSLAALWDASGARYHRNGIRLWAGAPPEPNAGPPSLRERWHQTHPASLRFAIRVVMRTRNVAARLRLAGRSTVEWRPA